MYTGMSKTLRIISIMTNAVFNTPYRPVTKGSPSPMTEAGNSRNILQQARKLVLIQFIID
jgi:hypothetical protein